MPNYVIYIGMILTASWPICVGSYWKLRWWPPVHARYDGFEALFIKHQLDGDDRKSFNYPLMTILLGPFCYLLILPPIREWISKKIDLNYYGVRTLHNRDVTLAYRDLLSMGYHRIDGVLTVYGCDFHILALEHKQ